MSASFYNALGKVLEDVTDEDLAETLEMLMSAVMPFAGLPHDERGTVPTMGWCPNCDHEWPLFYTPAPMGKAAGMGMLARCPRCFCNSNLRMGPPT